MAWHNDYSHNADHSFDSNVHNADRHVGGYSQRTDSGSSFIVCLLRNSRLTVSRPWRHCTQKTSQSDEHRNLTHARLASFVLAKGKFEGTGCNTLA